MFDLLLAAAVICLGSLTLGQLVLALCGADRWSWLAPPIGVSALILIAVPAIHVPGRATTMAVVGALLIAMGVGLWVRRPAQRPPLADVLAALPVALLVLVPFLAAGRVGTLGVSFDNDMGEHLLLAEAYRSSAVAAVSPLLPDYPLGPHALAAVLAQGLSMRVDLTFAAVTATAPVLLAWTALASVRRSNWLARTAAASIVGIPFLIAAYYGQGSFKELLEALFALAVAVMLAGFAPKLGDRRRWIALAVVCAGAISVYSLQGLVWPGAIVVVWLVGRSVITAWRGGLRSAVVELRDELVPGAIGLAVLVVLLIPQLPRIEKFVSKGAGGAIATSNLGNLVGPLSGWEMFGAWGNPDYQLSPTSLFTSGMWTAFVLALVVLGALSMIRGRRWVLAMAAGVAVLVWAYSAHTQSPYVAAKALVIASPLVLLLAAQAVLERAPTQLRWWRVLAPVLAVLLVGRVLDASWEALRFSKVGPTNHLLELRSLRGLVGRQPTLFLGVDDFVEWEMAGAKVTPAYYAYPRVPLRPEKDFEYGQALDFDSVTAATLNSFDWVVTTRDAGGSEAPAAMRLVKQTRNFQLWQRVGTVTPRKILNEGPGPAAQLDCNTAAGRALLREGGVAAVRQPWVVEPVPPLAPGASASVSLQLGAGTWELESPYLSPLPLKVKALGLSTTLDANLDRPGPRWPIGRIRLSRAQTVNVTFTVIKHWLTPGSDVATPTSLIATPIGTEHIEPIRQACGQWVDWYRS